MTQRIHISSPLLKSFFLNYTVLSDSELGKTLAAVGEGRWGGTFFFSPFIVPAPVKKIITCQHHLLLCPLKALLFPDVPASLLQARKKQKYSGYTEAASFSSPPPPAPPRVTFTFILCRFLLLFLCTSHLPHSSIRDHQNPLWCFSP